MPSPVRQLFPFIFSNYSFILRHPRVLTCDRVRMDRRCGFMYNMDLVLLYATDAYTLSRLYLTTTHDHSRVTCSNKRTYTSQDPLSRP